MAGTGWNRPLDIEMNVRKPELASAFQTGYDRSGLKRKSGRLRAELGKIANYTIRKIRNGVMILLRIALPYAELRDQGGRIPDRRPKTARVMSYFAYGQQWFMKFVKGYDVQPANYVEGGVEAFADRYAIEGGITVKWKG